MRRLCTARVRLSVEDWLWRKTPEVKWTAGELSEEQRGVMLQVKKAVEESDWREVMEIYRSLPQDSPLR